MPTLPSIAEVVLDHVVQIDAGGGPLGQGGGGEGKDGGERDDEDADGGASG